MVYGICHHFLEIEMVYSCMVTGTCFFFFRFLLIFPKKHFQADTYGDVLMIPLSVVFLGYFRHSCLRNP